ncbi:SDR family NAD(P)-dependent oxidoreductase [Virgibacillus kekensis]|uniref:SDR family NAD(P)-dependent oxidoreductase n=1 Tax=Virgibacillus kekensis TaxID=202261 RepID=A0ABV9DIQ5_9BACI
MQNRIRGKKIIITGASSGIGERLAWYIAKNGGVPIMIARSIDKLEQNQREIEQAFGMKSHVYQADLLNEQELKTVIGRILDEHPPIHGLINNAGSGVFEYVEDMEWEDVTRMFQLNVLALVQGTKLVLPHFKGNREGHIVNIASMAGKIATPKSAVYASTKHAVLGFTNALRLEAAPHNIHITAVNLGPVRTNFFAVADPGGSYQQSVERYMLDPDKVAEKVADSLFTPKREINMPWWMEAATKIYHLSPRLLEKMMKGQFNKK